MLTLPLSQSGKRREILPPKETRLPKEVQKLFRDGFVREMQYPKWLSNVVLVKKHSGKWKICVDFEDLKKTCHKESFPLLKIYQLVDATTAHEMLSFMDAYSSYN